MFSTFTAKLPEDSAEYRSMYEVHAGQLEFGCYSSYTKKSSTLNIVLSLSWQVSFLVHQRNK